MGLHALEMDMGSREHEDDDDHDDFL